MTAAEKAFLRRYGPFEVLTCADDGSLTVRPGLRDFEVADDRTRAERIIQALLDEATRP